MSMQRAIQVLMEMEDDGSSTYDQVTIRRLMGPSSTASSLGTWELVPELDGCLDMHKQWGVRNLARQGL